MEKGHKCEFYSGKISGVLYNRSKNTLRCERCLKLLSEEEVNPEILKKIKDRK